MKQNILIVILLLMSTKTTVAQTDDPYLWLEDIDSKPSMDWVNLQSTATTDLLSSQPEYQEIYRNCLEIYDSANRIARPGIRGEFIYNFWKDKDHQRGLWRRASRQSYLGGDPEWETLIVMDELSRKDGVNWDYHGVFGLFPSYSRFLIQLSRGGGDATVLREYDAVKKSFVDEGFSMPESKGDATYLDENTLLVSRDFGEGTLTSSGYSRQVRRWRRGTDIKDAPVIHKGAVTDVGVWAESFKTAERAYPVIIQEHTAYSRTTYGYEQGDLINLNIPDDAYITDFVKDRAIIRLRSDWKAGRQTFRQGSVISADYPALLKGKRDLKLIACPDDSSSIEDVMAAGDKLLVKMLRNVRSILYICAYRNGRWTKTKADTPEYGSIQLATADLSSGQYFYYYEDFVTPSSLYYADAVSGAQRMIKSMPAYFDGGRYRAWQYLARSKDGTMVPYFVVGPESIRYDGSNPTLIYAYGGFEHAMLPYYLEDWGKGWLEKGGVFVLANIRGGGEFGPRWHQAGLKEKRQNVFDDFYAVSEDLIARKITTPRHLGIMGGSNGGLLMGVALTQRPELYRAVVCGAPLLDMQRYNKLLAGASWMAEYGDPDIPEEWAYLKKYSPYHNLKPGVKYPEVLFTTSTRDDRVHPGHARKMAARMSEMGCRVLYYENTEGGHGGSSTNSQMAKRAALEYTFLLMNLR